MKTLQKHRNIKKKTLQKCKSTGKKMPLKCRSTKKNIIIVQEHIRDLKSGIKINENIGIFGFLIIIIIIIIIDVIDTNNISGYNGKEKGNLCQ